MNRRVFLKNSSLMIALVSTTPLISGCVMAAPALQGVTSLAAKTVGEWFVEFMVSVSANIVSDTIKRWFDDRTQTEQDHILTVNNMMEENGFVYFDERKVYQTGDNNYCYEVGHQDKFNGCAPFFDGFKTGAMPPMIEGPTAVGLALASEELRLSNTNTGAIRQMLVPIQETQRPTANAFGRNYDKQYVTLTEFGSAIIGYEVTGGTTGSVSVLLSDRNGIQFFGKQYDLQFKT